MSPSSSRKSVPPSAAAKRPSASPTAPVKAPRLWPKSVDSSSAGARAPQLTAMKGRSLRRLRAWRYRAKTSLPVPDSPVMRMGTSVGAARSQRERASTKGGDAPRRPPASLAWEVSASESSATRSSSASRAAARATTARSTSGSTGLARKSYAPRCTRWSESGVSPAPETTMILAAGRAARNFSASAAPAAGRPEGGSIRSRTTSRAPDEAKRAAASGSVAAGTTW